MLLNLLYLPGLFECLCQIGSRWKQDDMKLQGIRKHWLATKQVGSDGGWHPENDVVKYTLVWPEKWDVVLANGTFLKGNESLLFDSSIAHLKKCMNTIQMHFFKRPKQIITNGRFEVNPPDVKRGKRHFNVNLHISNCTSAAAKSRKLAGNLTDGKRLFEEDQVIKAGS